MEPGQATAPRSSDRMLWGIIGGAALLVLAGFALLFVVRDRPPEHYPEDTPQGVIQRYLQALSEGRYTEAEEYFSASVRQKNPDGFRYPPSRVPERSQRVVMQDVRVDGDRATVTVAVSHFSPGGGGLFDGPSEWTSTHVYELRRENGDWRIVMPEYFDPIFY